MTSRAPAPYPWRSGAAGLIVDETFENWASKGWALQQSTEKVEPASWFDDGSSSAAIVQGSVLFTWFTGGEPDNDPFVRSAYIEKTYTGFAPNQPVMVALTMRWSLGVGFPGGPGSAGGNEFFGAIANGERMGLSGPVFFGDGSGTVRAMVNADESGEIVVQCGVIGVHPSMNLDGAFYTITIGPPSSVQRYIVDTAGLWANGYPISITRQGFAFDPQETYLEYDYPGKVGSVEGLEELDSMKPVLRGVFLFVGEYELSLYRPGGTWAAHATIPNARTYTLASFRAAIGSGISMANVLAVWRLSDGWFFGVEFMKGRCKRWGVHGADKNEGEIAVEVEALWAAGASRKSPPYRLHLYPPGTEFTF